jgi:hypothetical protein
LQLQVILAEEDNPPTGHALVAGSKLARVKLGRRCLHWSWLIERFHFVLKSGCRFTTGERRAPETCTWYRCLAFVTTKRVANQSNHAAKCSWQALYCFHHRTPHPPPHPPTLRQAVHWIARLGGFLGRRADGEPGVKTIWLGFRRLADIAAAWQLMHSMLGNSPST